MSGSIAGVNRVIPYASISESAFCSIDLGPRAD